MIICVLLIVERHCLEYLSQKDSSDHLQGFLQLGKISMKKKASVLLLRLLKFFRALSEAVIPMLLLFIAFEKLTFISGIYLLLILCVSISNKSKQKLYFSVAVAIMIILQYLLILSNKNSHNSPLTLEVKDPINLPWYDNLTWVTADDASFMNLGADLSQLHGILWDMIVLLLCLFHFIVLSRENDRSKNYDVKKSIVKGSDEAKKKAESEKIKALLESLKKMVFRFSRFVFLFFVLIFSTKSAGLISVIYIVFSLLLILREINLNQQNLNSYSKLLAYLLIYTMLDLIVQFIFQIPFGIFNEYEKSNLFEVIGVKRL